MNSTLKQLKTFGKLSISLPIALTSYTGYILFDEQLSGEGLLVALGIFFLSAGASALNQLQEIKEDTLMVRTQNRPLPQGKIKTNEAIALILAFLSIGTFFLIPFGWLAAFWGWMGVIWYNLIYTPLKKLTAFSVFPGAIVGAIPPVAGWVAAGGSIIDVRIHFLAFFFFLGQMPHFWLLVLKYKDQYKKAGFPIITDRLKKRQIIRINLIWFLATFISVLFLPAFDLIDRHVIIWIITPSTILMMIWAVGTTIGTNEANKKKHLRQQFIVFNSFYLWIMLLIYIDKI